MLGCAEHDAVGEGSHHRWDHRPARAIVIDSLDKAARDVDRSRIVDALRHTRRASATEDARSVERMGHDRLTLRCLPIRYVVRDAIRSLQPD